MRVQDIKINQLVEIEMEDGDIKTYLPSRIEEITDLHLYLATPMKKGIVLVMRTGREIRVIFRYKNSTYGFDTQVLGRRHHPIPVLIVAKPEEIFSVQQKRNYVRLAVALPVRFRIVSEAEEEKIEAGTTIDISAGGAMFITSAKIKLTDQLEFELQLSEDESICCGAQVVRLLNNPERISGMQVAVEFDNITEGQRDRIFKFVFNKQREWIRKGLIE